MSGTGEQEGPTAVSIKNINGATRLRRDMLGLSKEHQ